MPPPSASSRIIARRTTSIHSSSTVLGARGETVCLPSPARTRSAAWPIDSERVDRYNGRSGDGIRLALIFQGVVVIRRVVIACVLWLAIAAGSAAAQTNASPGAHFAQHPSSSSVNAIAPACSANYYKNVNGVCVHRPSRSPRGATARCRDGTYSYSRHASGTCSHHGGVSRWIHHP